MNDKYNPDFNRGYFGKEAGSLFTDRPHRDGGKKVFEWKFNFSSIDKKPISIDVVLTKQMTFKAISSELNGGFIEHSDIQQLSVLVENDLLEKVNVLSGIEWEDWYQIEVTGRSSEFSDSQSSSWGSNLKINVTNIKRGIHPVTGVPVTIGQCGHITDFPTPTKIDQAEPDKGDFYKGNYCPGRPLAERSYIPATPENTAALRDILDRMDLLRSKLAEVLSNDRVRGTLMDTVKGLPLLREYA